MHQSNTIIRKIMLGIMLLIALINVPMFAQAGESQDETATALEQAGKNLAAEPWTAVIEAEIFPAGSEQPGRMDEMVVWYDPKGTVRLRLGHLLIEITPGRLVAFHEWNDDAYYIAVDPRKSIAQMIAAELPPLWCPWLAIALADGDISVWPVVGETGHAPLSWAGGMVLASGGSTNSAFRSNSSNPSAEHIALLLSFHSMQQDAEPITRYYGSLTPIMTGYKFWPAENENISKIHLWRRLRRETRETGGVVERNGRLVSKFVQTQETIWPNPTADGRTTVRTIAGLTPPLPELNVGDLFPQVSLSYHYPGRDLLGLWQPSEYIKSGRFGGEGQTKTALVLAVVRNPNPDQAWLAETAKAVVKARRTVGIVPNRRLGIAGHPVVATEATVADLDQIAEIGKAWSTAYTRHDKNDRFPGTIPTVSWLPATMLLDRVTPGAPAAIVVIDRSGWIVGVIGPDVSGKALDEALAEAIRKADR